MAAIFITSLSIFISWISVTPATGLVAPTNRAPSLAVIFIKAPVARCPGTVARAYQILTQEGILAATVGRGTFVAARNVRLGPTQPLYTELDPGVL